MGSCSYIGHTKALVLISGSENIITSNPEHATTKNTQKKRTHACSYTGEGFGFCPFNTKHAQHSSGYSCIFY